MEIHVHRRRILTAWADGEVKVEGCCSDRSVPGNSQNQQVVALNPRLGTSLGPN